MTGLTGGATPVPQGVVLSLERMSGIQEIDAAATLTVWAGTPLQAVQEAALAAALEQGIAADAVVAQSDTQARALWAVRDGSGEFRSVFWPHVGFDVSIPTGELGDFIQACGDAVRARWPQAKTVFFGHVGDSNIHIGVKVGNAEQPHQALDELVYDLVRRWNGSISAEHGIGALKRAYLRHSRSAEELVEKYVGLRF